MPFIDRKDTGVISQVLTTILDECENGITLADPDLADCPIIYANKAFERLTGYTQEDTLGKNCRFLQGHDRDQEARFQIKEGMKNKQAVDVNLRNYKKDGTLFYNRLKIVPLTDKNGGVLYFLGLQYDMTYQVDAEAEIKKLTALLNK